MLTHLEALIIFLIFGLALAADRLLDHYGIR
jgi:hypothetical protein